MAKPKKTTPKKTTTKAKKTVRTSPAKVGTKAPAKAKHLSKPTKSSKPAQKAKPAKKAPAKAPKTKKAASPAMAKPASKPTKKKLVAKAKKKIVAKKTSKPAVAAKSQKPAKKSSPATPAKKGATKSAKAKAAQSESNPRPTAAQLRKQIVAKARAGSKTQRASAFTLDDVRGEIARSAPEHKSAKSAKPEAAPLQKKATADVEIPVEQRRYEAASLAEILGYNPTANEAREDDASKIDRKYVRFYRLLVELRDHVNSGLQAHAEETLKRSSRDDSGDLSGYGQHMADAGTDNFDRDFALSLVSNEQEALYEIEEAIKRIRLGTYGICEVTGRPIAKERLLAVPFARYSVESQAQIEKTHRRSSQRGGVFGDASGEEGHKFLEEDSD